MSEVENLTARAESYETMQVAIGHVGWESGEHFDGGEDGGPEGSRHTLVYVTLGGKNALKGPNKGHPIICALPGGGFRIPPKGTMVYVVIPKGMEDAPGAGMIIATREDDPRSNLTKGESVDAAASGAARIIKKTDGSITLLTTADNTADGKVVALSISPSAFKFTAPWGSITLDASGLHIKTKAGPRLDMGGISIPGLSALIPEEAMAAFTGYFTVTAPTIKMAGANVLLGAGQAQNPAMYCVISAPTAVPPLPQSMSIQSQTVWVAP